MNYVEILDHYFALFTENKKIWLIQNFCWCIRRSISADWSEPTSHYAVGFADTISDNKLQTFSWISLFILLYNSECRIKDEDTIVGFCLFLLRFAIQILISKCLFSTYFSIEFKTCDKTILHCLENVSECELKLERERWPEPTVVIYHRQSPFVFNKRTVMRHYNNDINNSVY